MCRGEARFVEIVSNNVDTRGEQHGTLVLMGYVLVFDGYVFSYFRLAVHYYLYEVHVLVLIAQVSTNSKLSPGKPKQEQT